jgi:hypothetical protein
MQAESVCFERTYKSFESRRFFSELFAAGQSKHPLSLHSFRLRENGEGCRSGEKQIGKKEENSTIDRVLWNEPVVQ